jgi:hypothetical protein
MFKSPGLATRQAITLRRPGQSRARAWLAAAALTLAAGTAFAAAVAPQSALAAGRAPAVTFTPLKLINGWYTYPGAAKPAVADISGIIVLRGDIATAGTIPAAFRLPKAFRPASDVFLAAATCGANKGRLYIQRSGYVTVESEDGEFSNAACVTSLGGLSFGRTAASFTKLKLINGWQNAPSELTADASARLISGVVHLRGAIRTSGSNGDPLILPKGFRPAKEVYVPVDLCNANKGRLEIQSDGVVTVQAEQNFSDAACLTSLDGATFATSSKSFTPLKLQNGWHPYALGTYKPAVRISGGIVRFEGAIHTSGNPFAGPVFTLPKSMRPATQVYVEIDLTDANNGRLDILPDGKVFMYAEGGTTQHAQTFTSLDGAWFAH